MQVQMRVLMLAVMAVVEHNSVHVYMFLSHLFVKTYESKAVSEIYTQIPVPVPIIFKKVCLGFIVS